MKTKWRQSTVNASTIWPDHATLATKPYPPATGPISPAGQSIPIIVLQRKMLILTPFLNLAALLPMPMAAF
jgi:hypothetical protein